MTSFQTIKHIYAPLVTFWFWKKLKILGLFKFRVSKQSEGPDNRPTDFDDRISFTGEGWMNFLQTEYL
jgi:hypothetical protein